MSGPGFMGIDHIGIAVRPGDLESQVETYKQLGFSEIHREDVLGTDQVREVLLQSGNIRLQLLEPLSPQSLVAKQVERAIAHVAYRVADIQEAFHFLKEEGFRIIDEAPRPGSRGSLVFFVHPKSLGYLMEVVQTKVSQD